MNNINSKFFSAGDRTQSKLKFVVTDMKKNQLQELFTKVKDGGKIIEDLPIIGGYSVELNPNLLKDLFKNAPDNANFTLDQKIKWIPPVKNTGNRMRANLDIAKTTLGMEKVWAKGFTGKGMTICVIDTGIYPHEDLAKRIIDFKDIVNGKDGKPYDDNGHGTHCAGDAAGDGTASNKKYVGPAFEANLVGVKVLDGGGSGSFSDVIKGIQYAVDKKKAFNEGKAGGININVISMSLGAWASKPWNKDPVALAMEKAVEAGIFCSVAAGNDGPTKATIGTPAIAPNVFTTGAMDDKGTVDRADDDIAYFSSRGPTIDKLVKPNAITPGVNIMAPLAPDSELASAPVPKTPDNKYAEISGTSMATPIMAGIATTILQANPNLKPSEVGDIIMKTAVKLSAHTNYDANTIGSGMAEPEKAIEAALAKKSAKAA